MAVHVKRPAVGKISEMMEGNARACKGAFLFGANFHQHELLTPDE